MHMIKCKNYLDNFMDLANYLPGVLKRCYLSSEKLDSDLKCSRFKSLCKFIIKELSHLFKIWLKGEVSQLRRRMLFYMCLNTWGSDIKNY